HDAARRRCRGSGTVRAERGSISARPKPRAEIAVPLARDGIAAHAAVPSRKVLRGAIPARSGAPHGPSRSPETSALPHLSALTRVARREETTHRRLCQARRTASFLELKRVRLRSHPESP